VSRRSAFVVIAVVAVLATLLLGWQSGAINRIFGSDAGQDVARAERAVSSLTLAGSASNAVSSSGQQIKGSSAARLHALYARRGDPTQLARDAANSDDPVLWVRSLESITLCVNERVAKPASEETLRKVMADGKNGLTVEQVLAMRARAREQPAMRWAAGESFMNALVTIFSDKRQRPTADIRDEVNQAMAAPLSDAERTARDRLIAGLRAHCEASKPNETYWPEFWSARDKWLAQGATGALLLNAKAGWTSKKFSELSDADYQLVERIVRERQPDGLARLLLLSNSRDLGLISETDRLADPRAGMAVLEGGRAVAAMAACELGVADCSANSPGFMELCVNAGGCHLPDIASLARYILARDGLDPQWLDRETERVVRAIREGNLDALGIRRKPPQ